MALDKEDVKFIVPGGRSFDDQLELLIASIEKGEQAEYYDLLVAVQKDLCARHNDNPRR